MSEISHPVDAPAALKALKEGNWRFANNLRSVEALAAQSRRGALVASQSPFAVILCCSDSRVPAEIVFDCGLGDLFVVRVAGNVVAPSLVGSIEFAAATFGTKLVVVLGHSRCGAVAATVDVLRGGADAPSANVREIIERITPAVRDVAATDIPREEAVRLGVRHNVIASARALRTTSPVLSARASSGQVTIVGAEYALETGVISFFDGVDAISA